MCLISFKLERVYSDSKPSYEVRDLKVISKEFCTDEFLESDAYCYGDNKTCYIFIAGVEETLKNGWVLSKKQIKKILKKLKRCKKNYRKANWCGSKKINF